MLVSSGWESGFFYTHSQTPVPMGWSPADGGYYSFTVHTTKNSPPCFIQRELHPPAVYTEIAAVTEMLEEFFTAYSFRGTHLAQQKLNIFKSTVRNRPENIKAL